jgi:glyoxylase-like metal-dependent hydrolase (beta-lactamase superfamily II)
MEQIVPGLYASRPEPLSFAPGARIRAFLLRRPAGNLLVYANGRVAEAAEEIEALGGVERHVLTHWHEAGMGAADIARRLHAPVLCHAADREKAEKEVAIAGSFDARDAFAEDLEVIPIPGHTPGATAILWRGPRHRCLFTADSLFVSEGEWRVAVLEGSDRAAYLESLAAIRELDFDLLVPWIASAGAGPTTSVSQDTVRQRLAAVIDRVRAGATR